MLIDALAGKRAAAAAAAAATEAAAAGVTAEEAAALRATTAALQKQLEEARFGPPPVLLSLMRRASCHPDIYAPCNRSQAAGWPAAATSPLLRHGLNMPFYLHSRRPALPPAPATSPAACQCIHLACRAARLPLHSGLSGFDMHPALPGHI